ncbi:MAG: DUF2780 domain-containing protein [Methylococcales bacterium]|nr:DUF2780 domain-containing protein [Methylococcales bacterium]
MKNFKITLICTSLVFSGAASAGWLDFLNQADDAAETVQKTTSTIKTINNAAQNTQAVAQTAQVSLVDTLVKQLGVTPAQATGGSGALFQVAKSRMTDAAFGELSQSVPGMSGLLAAVPKAQPASATGDLLSGLAAASGNSTLVNAASLVSTFQQLNLSEGMISQFTPIVIDYVRQNGGEITANLLKTALSGS